MSGTSLKVSLVGDCGVGKTTFVKTIVEAALSPNIFEDIKSSLSTKSSLSSSSNSAVSKYEFLYFWFIYSLLDEKFP